uniref:S-acyl fatty acid synthase thioesterase, medium chain n=1 Tax=Corvus moneduloides TaxID=1196302 RepID=A0A8C3ECM8_CORMO
MEKLIACVHKRPDALFRLICFPWAGGGALQLAQWGKLFNDSIEVCSIRFPGRETRLEEPFAKDMTSIVNEVTNVLLKELKEKPFAFFGHSFGSYVSFAVALHLKEKYGLEPVHLFISEGHAPHVSYGIINIMKQNCKLEVIARLQILGGIPSELQHNEDILKQMVLTKAEMDIPFSCDITCFHGSDDEVHDVQAWQELTSGDTSFYELPGGHFYLLEPSNQTFLTKHITRCIENAGL